jgi:hypothetical protein
MGDPQGALTHTKNVIKKDENNLNPVGRTFYAASTLICVPNSLAFNGPALGAQAGENRIKDIVNKSGFSYFRRVLETPINIIYEAKP